MENDATGPFVHPYIPNSAPEVKRQMLDEMGLTDIEEILAEIPRDLRLDRLLDLPEPLTSELDLRRHVEGILERNTSCAEYLSFLGGGCWNHFVPAVCDEIVGRGEFLTAYSGGSYSDLGKHQARFEYNSLMAELLDYEVVVEPTYDWGSAAAFAARMAARITGRREVLVPENLGRERLSIIRELCEPEFMERHLPVRLVACDPRTGQLLLDDLRRSLSQATAAVYFENPGYLGQLEPAAAEICDLARASGAISIAGVDPISLGHRRVSRQLRGRHRRRRSAASGHPHELRDRALRLHGVPRRRPVRRGVPLRHLHDPRDRSPGQHTFGELLSGRTSYGQREKAPDWVGTQTGLWAICAAVYLALMGPQGMREVGDTIVRRAHYAARALSASRGHASDGRRLLQGVPGLLRRHRQVRQGCERGLLDSACSAVAICPSTTRGSGRARSTVSPRSTPGSTSIV